MEEIFDVYTRDGKYLGTRTKSFCHGENPGCYHKPVWITIINNKGQILIQKRAKTTKSHPGLWQIGCAGHVDAKETSIEGAIRETKEEFGIITKEEDYLFVGEYIDDTTWEIGQMYLLKINNNISEFKFQVEEVDKAKWVGLDDFKLLIYSNDFLPAPDKYKKIIIELLEKHTKV